MPVETPECLCSPFLLEGEAEDDGDQAAELVEPPAASEILGNPQNAESDVENGVAASKAGGDGSVVSDPCSWYEIRCR